MKKEIKKVKTSTKILKPSNKPHSKWVCDYRNINSAETVIATEAFIEGVGKNLLDWANQDSSLVHSDFLTSRGIPRRTYYDWVDKFPFFKDCHDSAKSIIGSRREIGAIDRRFNENVVSRMAGFYSQDWKDMEEWRSKMKTEQAASTQPTQIILGSLQGVKES